MPTQPLKAESAVKQLYASAAKRSEQALCCPVDYDKKYLEIIPAEVVKKDYGCGGPINPRETKGRDCKATAQAGQCFDLGSCC